ncbi:MAG TPA: YlxR family protein [Dehalococcoidia bacterium]|nr:YlxR family protein [Dehalococcoidia bacterium]
MTSFQTTTQRPRHTPQRRCIGCSTGADKRSLIRLVRTPAGQVEVDPTGKAAGRGAYLCSRTECWQAALKRGRLEQALRTTLTAENRARLQDLAAGLVTEAQS